VKKILMKFQEKGIRWLLLLPHHMSSPQLQSLAKTCSAFLAPLLVFMVDLLKELGMIAVKMVRYFVA
jgi:hypothetical protein